MDAISMIVGALLAGATAGIGDATTRTVTDTYDAFRGRLSGLIRGQRKIENAIDDYLVDPASGDEALRTCLEESGVGSDRQLLDLAAQILRQLGTLSPSVGNHTVKAKVINGNSSGLIQINTFNGTRRPGRRGKKRSD